MTDKDDYVLPPGADPETGDGGDYVAPPGSGVAYGTPGETSGQDYVPPMTSGGGDYVPPVTGAGGDYVAPATSDSQDYVAPPSGQGGPVIPNKDYVAPPSSGQGGNKPIKPVPPQVKMPDNLQAKDQEKKGTGTKAKQKKEGDGKAQEVAKQKLNSYFAIPKMPLNFYFSSYLFWFMLIIWMGSDPVTYKVLFSLYGLLSNYTLSWFADYHRFKGDLLGRIYTPYGAAKLAMASSAMMDYTRSDVKRTWTGNYVAKGKRDLGQHAVTFIIIWVITESLKLLLSFPLAFLSMFFHKSTIRKYYQAVEAAQ